MSTLYIIGNGFDLAHDLKTGYPDFLCWYLKEGLKKMLKDHYFNDSLVEFKTISPININHIQDFQELTNEFSSRGIRIDYQPGLIKDIFNEVINKKWVDIENLYFNSLVNIAALSPSKRDVAIKTLNKQFKILQNYLEEYLSQLPKTIELKEDITNHFHEINTSSEMSLVLNFNYTNYISQYIKSHNRKNIVFIHGEIKNKLNPIIFGYGDEMHKKYAEIEQLDNNDFLQFFKTFGYSKTSNYSFLDFFLGRKYRVKIMGHSCGLSDRVLLNKIFEHQNCMGIEICYHQRSSKDDDNDHFEKVINISRHFSTEGKDLVRTRIVSREKSSPLVSFKSE